MYGAPHRHLRRWKAGTLVRRGAEPRPRRARRRVRLRRPALRGGGRRGGGAPRRVAHRQRLRVPPPLRGRTRRALCPLPGAGRPRGRGRRARDRPAGRRRGAQLALLRRVRRNRHARLGPRRPRARPPDADRLPRGLRGPLRRLRREPEPLARPCARARARPPLGRAARAEARLTRVEPFRIEVPEAELDDLRDRLRRTRWPERETVADWSQGVPLEYLEELCDHWASEYDWRATEARLNALPQFRTEIDGLLIHFVHVRSERADAIPLVMTHGWPGSVVEFLKVIGPLSDDFHLVIPSLPGYGFSDKPATPGWGIERIADAWAELMARLGYERYGAQGSDWGTSVSSVLGRREPEHVLGIHLMPPLAPPDPDTFDDLTEAERAALQDLERASEFDSGYSKEHATRPQTIGYSLTDSPAGLAAWIIEKFWAWTDCDGHLENAIPRDELLDN